MSLELVFVHFPKAAGTSLIHALRRHYAESLMVDYDHPPPVDWSYEPPRLVDGTRAVCGHFHANRYAAHRDAFRFTFLREPVDNLISIFHFWRTFPPSGYPAHERFLAESPTIFEFAQYPEVQRLSSACYFGGVDIRRFDFVGFFERRAEDLSKLSGKLGFDLSTDIYVNKTNHEFDRERAELKADSCALRKIRDRLADDVAFYERAREFWP